MRAREPVVWEIICLPSWTKVASCLHDGLKRVHWDVDFKNSQGDCGVPKKVKSSLYPGINIFLFVFFFSVESTLGRTRSLQGMVDSIDADVFFFVFPGTRREMRRLQRKNYG